MSSKLKKIIIIAFCAVIAVTAVLIPSISYAVYRDSIKVVTPTPSEETPPEEEPEPAAQLQSIEATLADGVAYYKYGYANVEAEDISVTAHYSDGTSAVVEDGYIVSVDDDFAKAGGKKLAEYNSRPNPVPVIDENGVEAPAKMPVLIVIIDELAELMMTDARKDSEAYITRIAQLGRAAGVHIVVATQRPSTQIITGVIKANLPTRIAFRVGQMIDSRVILDQNGAEKLLGSGDMLFLAPGGMDLERVQGAWVKDEDIKQVVKFVSDQVPQSFNAQVVAEEEAMEEEIDENVTDYDDDDYRDIAPVIKKYMRPGDDDNIRRALEVVVLDRKASTSYLQRRLKIGYNRAAEIMDLFEERGIVGPASGSGNKREILIFDGMDEE